MYNPHDPLHQGPAEFLIPDCSTPEYPYESPEWAILSRLKELTLEIKDREATISSAEVNLESHKKRLTQLREQTLRFERTLALITAKQHEKN